MIQMAFCDLLHTFHKQVTNVSQHVFVILLWGILTSPLIMGLYTHTVPSNLAMDLSFRTNNLMHGEWVLVATCNLIVHNSIVQKANIETYMYINMICI